jgi:hypothetical protein
MKFRWDQVIPDEKEASEPPPIWIYLVLFIAVECVALALTVATWPTGKPIAPKEFLRGVLLIGPVFWGAVCAFVYYGAHGMYAFEAAVFNQEGWRLRRSWQYESRSGVAVLDSVVLAPEPDLAERMLSLDGTPPQNPGKVMALDMNETGAESRLYAVLKELLMPLAPKLAAAMHSNSFQLMMQGDRDESSDIIHAVWKKLELPGAPDIVCMRPTTEPKFAERWFPADCGPYHRLVLAWHLNDAGPEVAEDYSEFAVALLLGSSQLMYDKRDKLRAQAWLLRGIATEADQVEDALTLLLQAGQVETKRIRHFWHSRLKGLARHATLGAIRDSGLEVSGHALEPAIGPQAPMSRWLLYALAARMAYFGQGAQLVAQPGEKGVMLSLAVREPQPVNAPWKDSYGYWIIPTAEFVFISLSMIGLLLLDSGSGSSGPDTTIAVAWPLLIAAFFVERYFRSRRLVEDFWSLYRREA